MPEPHTTPARPLVRIALSRVLTLERALTRIVPGAFLMVVAYSVIRSLSFRPSGVSNRITDYSLAVVVAPAGMAGVWLVYRGFRWLAATVWPAWIGVDINTEVVAFRFGPLGRDEFDLGRLDVRYPFEIPSDELDEEASFEAFIDPKEQVATMLPRMQIPGVSERIEGRMIRYLRMDEQALVDRLRPFIEYARRDRDRLHHPEESGDDPDDCVCDKSGQLQHDGVEKQCNKIHE